MTYEDDDVETLNISDESWRFLLDQSTHANRAKLELCSNEPLVLQQLLSTFGNKPFMWHHAQGFSNMCYTWRTKVKKTPFRKLLKSFLVDWSQMMQTLSRRMFYTKSKSITTLRFR